MHVATLLKAGMFAVEIDGAKASIDALFPDWTPLDRFGIVIDETLGGIGGSHLIHVAMMAYYDVKPSRRSSLAVYPEIYAFHLGKSHGAHSAFDFWPKRREIVLRTGDHREILDAINDRGITRLAVPDRPPRVVTHRPKEVDAALDRIASAFLYDPSGRTEGGDVTITGLNKRTEYNPLEVLDPPPKEPKKRAAIPAGRPLKEAEDDYYNRLRELETEITAAERAAVQARRAAMTSPGGMVFETYRRVGVAEALERLAGARCPGPA